MGHPAEAAAGYEAALAAAGREVPELRARLVRARGMSGADHAGPVPAWLATAAHALQWMLRKRYAEAVADRDRAFAHISRSLDRLRPELAESLAPHPTGLRECGRAAAGDRRPVAERLP